MRQILYLEIKFLHCYTALISSQDLTEEPKKFNQLKKQDEPTLNLLMSFPVHEKLDITREIGKSTKFGILLLNDKRGTKMQEIGDENRNYKILEHWIHGEGRKPVTWETLVVVLKEAGLETLASDIDNSLL